MKAFHHLSQAFRLRGDCGDVILKLGVSLPEVRIFPGQALVRRWQVHVFRLQPARSKRRGKARTLRTLNADATKSVAILVSESIAAGRIDRFGGGTRPTALFIGGGSRQDNQGPCRKAAVTAGRELARVSWVWAPRPFAAERGDHAAGQHARGAKPGPSFGGQSRKSKEKRCAGVSRSQEDPVPEWTGASRPWGALHSGGHGAHTE